MKKLLLITIVVFGCAPVGRPRHLSVDPSLLPYYRSFVNEAVRWHVIISQKDFVMIFGDTDGSVGICILSADSASIHIDKDSWEWLADSEREELTYHEMGHCLLGRDHRTGLVSIYGEDIPLSIMNEYLFDGSYLTKYHEYYMQELFNESL